MELKAVALADLQCRRAEAADQLLSGKARQAVLLFRLRLDDRLRWRSGDLRPRGAGGGEKHERKGD